MGGEIAIDLFLTGISPGIDLSVDLQRRFGVFFRLDWLFDRDVVPADGEEVEGVVVEGVDEALFLGEAGG